MAGALSCALEARAAAIVLELSRASRIERTSLLQCSAIPLLFNFERHAAFGRLPRFCLTTPARLQADAVR